LLFIFIIPKMIALALAKTGTVRALVTMVDGNTFTMAVPAYSITGMVIPKQQRDADGIHSCG
jgi:hypothetical protein